MSVQSMTGFARAAGGRDGLRAVWEVKSVNGKSLDARLRLPPGLDRLEPAVRQAVRRHFSRGNLQLTVTLTQAEETPAVPVVNEALLSHLATLARRLTVEFGAAPASADGLLSLRGVLDVPEPAETEAMQEDRDRLVMAVLEETLTELAASRRAEGAALAAILRGQIEGIEALTAAAEADPSRDPAAIRERLAAQVALLLEARIGMDENRLAAEAALLATRADIREEIDRLKIHCAAARALLLAGGPVGRRLDFLGQEFNREANTLCSKSNAASVMAKGLELKALVDQFREQVQNLE